MSGAPASPFPADALAANQAGQLTDAQRSLYAANDRSFRKTELYVAVGAIVVALLLLTSSGPASDNLLRPVAIGICVVLAAVLVVRSTLARDSLSSDLSNRAVVSIDGAILKRAVHGRSGGSSATTHYLVVAGTQFEVGSRFYEAAPDAGYVKVYYLPKSKTLVNLEVLPDRPLPAGMAEDPAAAAQLVVSELKTHDSNSRAEAMAQMAVLKKSYERDDAASAVPPPADQPGQAPLAQAIVGTWRTGPVTVTFSADGTMSTAMPGGHDMAGRWSVDPAGQLHAQVAGRDLAGQAWVAGNTLTIKEGDEGRVFQRA